MDRSLAACEQLYNAGFENLFWVQGGLEAAEEEVAPYKKISSYACALFLNIYQILPSFTFRILRGKVPSLSSLLLLEGFLNSLGKFCGLSCVSCCSLTKMPTQFVLLE